LKSDDVSLERRIPGHDEFALGVNRVHQVRFNGLTDFDRIIPAYFDLEACSFGKDGLRGRYAARRVRIGRGGGGTLLKRLRARESAEG
jgi:hypothetical protein